MKIFQWKIGLLAAAWLAVFLFSGLCVQAKPSSSKNDEFGKAVGKMARQYKKQGSGAQSLSDPYFSARLIVKGKNGSLKFDEYGAVAVIRSSTNVYLVQFETSQDARDAHLKLKKNRKVVYVEPDGYMGTRVSGVRNAPPSSGRFKSWGVEHINADKYAAYLSKKTSQSITVAVVDSGVSKHSLIGDRLLQGYDFVDSDNDAADKYYHGTHVAGIIADCTRGLNVKILPVRVLNERGGGDESVIGAGITYAADHGAKVINLSLGGRHSKYIDECIDYAVKKGIVVCVSAGNQFGKDTAEVCPAHMKNTVVVGAVDALDRLGLFSNIGSSVDVVAPGVDIVSSTPGGKYQAVDGTSQAAPFVAAAAAMLRLTYPAKTAAQIEDLLRKNVHDLGKPGKDKLYGTGVLYLKVPNETVRPVNPTAISLSQSKVSLKTGESVTLTAKISPSGATNKTVSWKSSKSSVAAVSGGKITAKKAGTAVITAVTANGIKGSCTVTVKKAAPGSTYTEIPEVGYAANSSTQIKKAVRLKSGTNKLEGTEGVLKFTAPETGTYEFTFTALSGSDKIRSSKTRTTGVAYAQTYSYGYLLDLEENRVETQGGYSYSLEFCDSKSKKYYNSGDKVHRKIPNRYARVELKKGKALYFWVSMGVQEEGRNTLFPAKFRVTVKKKPGTDPTSISLSETAYTLKTGEVLKLEAAVKPINAKNKTVVWESSAADTVSVSGGTVTAIKPGTATITVSTANGIKASCKVTVQNPATDYSGCTMIPKCTALDGDSVIMNRAVSLNTGTNRAAGTEGYLKYTALADGVYEFTFIAVNGDGSSDSPEYPAPVKGSAYLQEVLELGGKDALGSMEDSRVETQGGYSAVIQFCDSKNAKAFQYYNSIDPKKTDDYIPDRYARIKLKNGEQVYFHIYLEWDDVMYDLNHTKLPPKMEVIVNKK